MPIWLREKLFQKNFLYQKLKQHDENFSDMNKINFAEAITQNDIKKENFIYSFLSSIRQKMQQRRN